MALVFAATFMVSLPGALAAHADGPSITLDPSTNLNYGQFIQASLNGYPAGIGVDFRQCIGGTQTPDLDTQCSPILPITAVTDPDGNSVIYLDVLPDPDAFPADGTGNLVFASANSSGTCDDSGNNPCFPCDEKDPCQYAAMTDPNDIGTAVFAEKPRMCGDPETAFEDLADR